MSFRGVKAVLLACSGIGVLLAATADANAGGFALREQSAFGQGSSFAGVAAGGSLSAMFWNPATMTQVPGLQSESVLSGIMPYSAHTPTSGNLIGTGDTAIDALVPSAYFSWQIRPNMWIGLSVNSPYGLSTTFSDAWAGKNYAESSSLKTYNATPSFAYQLNNWLSIGAGVQIQYMKADVGFGLPTGAGSILNIDGNGWGYGFTAGVTVTPTPTTTIGLGYRSAINQKLNGSLNITGLLSASSNGNVSTTVNLPDVVTLGIRQRVTPQWTLLGTVEWTNWSRIGTSVLTSNGAPVIVGPLAVTLPFQYQDGWFFSAGAEYQWTDQLMVRGGVGFERSPVTDQVRMPLVPDNDRTWLSAGATYQYTKKLSFDLAYSHIFVKSTSINIDASNPWFGVGGGYTGDISSHVDIISVAMKYRWDNPAPAPTSTLYHK